MGLTTDPRDECIQIIKPDGQQQCYLILPEEERAKGYIRPVRRSYIHIACGTETRMAQAIAETYARNPGFYGGTFCVSCHKHFDLTTPRGMSVHMHNPEKSAAEVCEMAGIEKIEWHFQWLDERDGMWDGTYVGE